MAYLLISGLGCFSPPLMFAIKESAYSGSEFQIPPTHCFKNLFVNGLWVSMKNYILSSRPGPQSLHGTLIAPLQPHILHNFHKNIIIFMTKTHICSKFNLEH